MNCGKICRKPRTSLKTWANQPLRYESSFYVKDVLDMISRDLYKWVTTRDDLECGLTYESFRSKYIRVLYYGYQTKNLSDAVSDYFDLKYLEQISEVYHSAMTQAAHYQIGLSSTTMMDTLEFIRDNTTIYDPSDDIDDETD